MSLLADIGREALALGQSKRAPVPQPTDPAGIATSMGTADPPPRPTSAGQPAAHEFAPQTKARILRVRDGDSFLVESGGKQFDIRLSNVNTPDWGEEGREKARAHLDSLLRGKEITFDATDTDAYGRTVGHATFDGRDLGDDIVTLGYGKRASMTGIPEAMDRDYKVGPRKPMEEPSALPPGSVGEQFRSGLFAGAKGVQSAMHGFYALGKQALGASQGSIDKSLTEMRFYDQEIQRETEGVEGFTDFLKNPTVGGFIDQVAGATGQMVPSILTSAGTGGAGGLVGGLAVTAGKGILKRGAKKAADRMIKEALEKRAKKEALSPDEELLLQTSYDGMKGVLVRKRAKRGAIIGAGGGEYPLVTGGMAQDVFDPENPATQGDPGAARAAGTLAMGVPAAVIGVGADVAVLKAMARLAGKQSAKEARKGKGVIRAIAGETLRTGRRTSLVEGGAEAGQEGLAVLNRAIGDASYLVDPEARWRVAEAAWMGALGSFLPGAAGGAGGAAVGQARTISDTKIIDDAKRMVSKAKQGKFTVGESTAAEPLADVTAQMDEVAGPGAKETAYFSPATVDRILESDGVHRDIKKAVRQAADGRESSEVFSAKIDGQTVLMRAVEENGEAAVAVSTLDQLSAVEAEEKLRNLAASENTEEARSQFLGHGALPDADSVVFEVKNDDGAIIHQQAVPPDRAAATRRSLAERFPGRDIGFVAPEDAVASRQTRVKTEDEPPGDVVEEPAAGPGPAAPSEQQRQMAYEADMAEIEAEDQEFADLTGAVMEDVPQGKVEERREVVEEMRRERFKAAEEEKAREYGITGDRKAPPLPDGPERDAQQEAKAERPRPAASDDEIFKYALPEEQPAGVKLKIKDAKGNIVREETLPAESVLQRAGELEQEFPGHIAEVENMPEVKRLTASPLTPSERATERGLARSRRGAEGWLRQDRNKKKERARQQRKKNKEAKVSRTLVLKGEAEAAAEGQARRLGMQPESLPGSESYLLETQKTPTGERRVRQRIYGHAAPIAGRNPFEGEGRAVRAKTRAGRDRWVLLDPPVDDSVQAEQRELGTAVAESLLQTLDKNDALALASGMVASTSKRRSDFGKMLSRAVSTAEQENRIGEAEARTTEGRESGTAKRATEVRALFSPLLAATANDGFRRQFNAERMQALARLYAEAPNATAKRRYRAMYAQAFRGARYDAALENVGPDAVMDDPSLIREGVERMLETSGVPASRNVSRAIANAIQGKRMEDVSADLDLGSTDSNILSDQLVGTISEREAEEEGLADVIDDPQEAGDFDPTAEAENPITGRAASLEVVGPEEENTTQAERELLSDGVDKHMRSFHDTLWNRQNWGRRKKTGWKAAATRRPGTPGRTEQEKARWDAFLTQLSEPERRTFLDTQGYVSNNDVSYILDALEPLVGRNNMEMRDEATVGGVHEVRVYIGPIHQATAREEHIESRLNDMVLNVANSNYRTDPQRPKPTDEHMAKGLWIKTPDGQIKQLNRFALMRVAGIGQVANLNANDAPAGYGMTDDQSVREGFIRGLKEIYARGYTLLNSATDGDIWDPTQSDMPGHAAIPKTFTKNTVANHRGWDRAAEGVEDDRNRAPDSMRKTVRQIMAVPPPRPMAPPLDDATIADSSRLVFPAGPETAEAQSMVRKAVREALVENGTEDDRADAMVKLIDLDGRTTPNRTVVSMVSGAYRKGNLKDRLAALATASPAEPEGAKRALQAAMAFVRGADSVHAEGERNVGNLLDSVNAGSGTGAAVLDQFPHVPADPRMQPLREMVDANRRDLIAAPEAERNDAYKAWRTATAALIKAERADFQRKRGNRMRAAQIALDQMELDSVAKASEVPAAQRWVRQETMADGLFKDYLQRIAAFEDPESARRNLILKENTAHRIAANLGAPEVEMSRHEDFMSGVAIDPDEAEDQYILNKYINKTTGGQAAVKAVRDAERQMELAQETLDKAEAATDSAVASAMAETRAVATAIRKAGTPETQEDRARLDGLHGEMRSLSKRLDGLRNNKRLASASRRFQIAKQAHEEAMADLPPMFRMDIGTFELPSKTHANSDLMRELPPDTAAGRRIERERWHEDELERTRKERGDARRRYRKSVMEFVASDPTARSEVRKSAKAVEDAQQAAGRMNDLHEASQSELRDAKRQRDEEIRSIQKLQREPAQRLSAASVQLHEAEMQLQELVMETVPGVAFGGRMGTGGNARFQEAQRAIARAQSRMDAAQRVSDAMGRRSVEMTRQGSDTAVAYEAAKERAGRAAGLKQEADRAVLRAKRDRKTLRAKHDNEARTMSSVAAGAYETKLRAEEAVAELEGRKGNEPFDEGMRKRLRALRTRAMAANRLKSLKGSGAEHAQTIKTARDARDAATAVRTLVNVMPNGTFEDAAAFLMASLRNPRGFGEAWSRTIKPAIPIFLDKEGRSGAELRPGFIDPENPSSSSGLRMRPTKRRTFGSTLEEVSAQTEMIAEEAEAAVEIEKGIIERNEKALDDADLIVENNGWAPTVPERRIAGTVSLEGNLRNAKGSAVTRVVDRFKSNIGRGLALDVRVSDQAGMRGRLDPMRPELRAVVSAELERMQTNDLAKGFVFFEQGQANIVLRDGTGGPEAAIQLAHELGHVVFRSELERLKNPEGKATAVGQRLIEAWKKDLETSSEYEGEGGFEEWYADKLAAHLVQPVKITDEHRKSGAAHAIRYFNQIAKKIRDWLVTAGRALYGNRFDRNAVFEQYVERMFDHYRRGFEPVQADVVANRGPRRVVDRKGQPGRQRFVPEGTAEFAPNVARRVGPFAEEGPLPPRAAQPRDPARDLVRYERSMDARIDSYRRAVQGIEGRDDAGTPPTPEQIAEIDRRYNESARLLAEREGLGAEQAVHFSRGNVAMASGRQSEAAAPQPETAPQPAVVQAPPLFSEKITPTHIVPETAGQSSVDRNTLEEQMMDALFASTDEGVRRLTAAPIKLVQDRVSRFKMPEFRKLPPKLKELSLGARETWDNGKLDAIKKVVYPANSHLEEMSPKLARFFAGRSGTSDAVGYHDAVARQINKWRNTLGSVLEVDDPSKPGSWTSPELEAAMLKAEDESIDTGDLDGPAKAIRQWLDRDIYETYLGRTDEAAFKEWKRKNPAHANMTLEDAAGSFKYRDSLGIGRRSNYFPRLMNMDRLRSSQLARDTLAGLIHTHVAEVESLPEAREIVRNMVAEGMDAPVSENEGIVEDSGYRPGMSAKNTRHLSEIPTKALRHEHLIQSPMTSLISYTEQLARSVEFRKRGGAATLNELLGEIEGERRYAAERNVRGQLGLFHIGLSPGWRVFNDATRALTVWTTLAFAALGSVGEPLAAIVRSNGVVNMRTSMRELARTVSSEENAELARAIGTAAPEALNTVFGSMVSQNDISPMLRKSMDWTFRATGINWITQYSRHLASGMGREFLLSAAKNPGRTRNQRYLDQLGVTAEQVRNWDSNGRPMKGPSAEPVLNAIARFAEESTVRPNYATQPALAADPRFAALYMLKSFSYDWGVRFLAGTGREVTQRVKSGEYSAAAGMLLLAGGLMLPIAALSLELREGLKFGVRAGASAVGIDTDPEAAFRTDEMGPFEYGLEMIDRAGFLGAGTIGLSVGQALASSGSLVDSLVPVAPAVKSVAAGDPVKAVPLLATAL